MINAKIMVNNNYCDDMIVIYPCILVQRAARIQGNFVSRN